MACGLRWAFLISAALSLATPAQAQDYPTRPITLIVPFAAGGSSDVNARLIAEQMSQRLGQPIVIENIGGAGGAVALARVAQAAPDGYTIVQGNSGTNTAVYLFTPDVKFAPSDFSPIGMFNKSSAVVAIRKNFPAQTLAEFIGHAKQNPGLLNIGHSGVGSQNYLFCKAFIQAAGIDVTLVGYRGGGPALNDLIGGQIDGLCDSSASVTPAIQSGLVRGIALASKTRLAHLPDLPTASEAGLPQFEISGWYALFAPKGTPQPVIDRLNGAMRGAVASRDYQKRLDDLGSSPADDAEMAPAYLAKFVPQEIEKFRKMLGEAK
ncbi:MAG: tricarboxylate transport protein [Tardiphaga sp.]|uniref:tripartite tricarboxylate transporter substrate-binding protein n=1 Tax=Tardiphaga sp. TaxID=1926292 RepID=UPI002639A4C8|nr:tripartite tricarboxylate transporter substrate-binding protein [Tardiphaga sp.]MDB5502525.1 tricarboxylate transport protein [Tardiphaga sp.]